MGAKSLVALAAALMVSACAMSQQMPADKPIRSVAIVSALPDTLTLDYVGFTVFNNVTQVVTVDWGLNAVAEETARNLLKDRYEHRQLTFDVTALKGVRTRSDITARSFKPVVEKLRQLVQPDVADAILLIDGMSDHREADALYRAVPMGPAVGARLLKGTDVSVLFTVAVYDGRTFEPIAFNYDSIRPLHDVQTLWSGEPWDRVSPSVKGILRTMAETYVREDLTNELARVGLIKR